MIPRFARSLLLVVVATRALAQTSTSPTPAGESNPAGRGIWLELGAGVGKAAGKTGDAAVSASLAWQQRQRLLSVRGDAVSTSWSSSIAQVALLLGRATIRSDARFASASLGLGFVHSDACVTNCGLFSSGPSVHSADDAIGATAVVNAAIRAGHRGGVGIGVSAFANVNSISSFAGATVSVSAGRWR